MRSRGAGPAGSSSSRVAVVACVVAVVLLVPVVATSSSSYCGSCHSMKQAYRSWQRGAHSSVPAPSATSRRARWPPSSGAPRRRATSGWLPQHAAREGHGSHRRPRELRQVPSAQGPHGHPRQDPHAARQAHQPEQPRVHRLPRPHRARRTRARAARSAWLPAPCVTSRPATPASCDFCHYTPPDERQVAPHRLPHGARQAGARQRAGLPALPPQQGSSSATAATQKPTPGHYSGELALRARPAGQEGPHALSRAATREEQLCNQCHTVDHPADWATSHAPVAAKGDRSCLVCHPQQMCVDCHAAEGVTTP